MGVLEKLDPFYWFDRFWFSVLGKPARADEKIIYHVAEFFYAIIVAYLLYIVLGILLHTSKPAVIVASQSMEPTLWPGDIAFVYGVDPQAIQAPSVHYDGNLSGKTLYDAGIEVVRDGTRLVGFRVSGQFIPLEANGDIIVYAHPLYGKDIIHRAVLKILADDGIFFLTKGDNSRTNPSVDQDCSLGFCINPYPVPSSRVYGKVFFVVPKIGMIKLLLFR